MKERIQRMRAQDLWGDTEQAHKEAMKLVRLNIRTLTKEQRDQLLNELRDALRGKGV